VAERAEPSVAAEAASREALGHLDTLETRAARASRDQLSPTEFLAILLDEELERREQTRAWRVRPRSYVS
jgi:hypothetical protein